VGKVSGKAQNFNFEAKPLQCLSTQKLCQIC
jgi:hypothetical protein